MKKKTLLLLILCANNAYSAGPMPSLDAPAGTSSLGYYQPYPDSTSSTPTSSTSSSLLDNVARLQADVSQLKTKLADQSKTASDLKLRLDYIEKHLSAGAVLPQAPSSIGGGTSYMPPVPAATNEKGRYDYAFALFKNGVYDQAISEFQAIITAYPNGEYADNSQYWTGEALLKKGDKQGAMRAFDRVIYAYPRSAKVPDALLKIGMTQFDLGNKAKAKEYYDYLIATYPGTTSATAAYDKKTKNGLY
jgi:tol-pal system protein YbgF